MPPITKGRGTLVLTQLEWHSIWLSMWRERSHPMPPPCDSAPAALLPSAPTAEPSSVPISLHTKGAADQRLDCAFWNVRLQSAHRSQRCAGH